MKRLRKSLFRISLTTIIITLALGSSAFASGSDVITDSINRTQELWHIIAAILSFFGLTASGIEISLKRTNPEERTKAMQGIPWLIGGIMFILFSGSIAMGIMSAA